MKKKTALITGVTGQDGSYLLEFLLKKKYIIHGIKRKSSSFNTKRIDKVYNRTRSSKNFFLHYGDLTDYNSLQKIIYDTKPDEIYNLAAQSHVADSFKIPIYTAQVNAIGALNILEIIRNSKKKIKFYQASSSEMYGKIQKKVQNEDTPFYPLSPYASSKLFAYWLTKNYRESFGIFAVNGILFNHESPRRGETFVTRKITLNLSKICFGLEECLKLGNIYSLRDWGDAREYIEMQWKMLQKKTPNDYVISTGYHQSIKQFLNISFEILKIKIKWQGSGLNEKAVVTEFDKSISPYIKKNQTIVRIDKKYFRPNEVENLIGDSSKAKKLLNWKPKKNLSKLISDMIKYDYNTIKKKFYNK